MRPPFYLRQLRIDLEDWIAKGLVPASSRDAILAGAGQSGGARLDLILAVFGVILLGAGVMSFVAANWDAMSKLARLVVLFGTMWAAYALAVFFIARDRPFIGQAFVLLGVLMFGANIMLIAQTYNINAHWPDGTLMWGAGALAAAVLVPSRASLAAALALGALWTWQEWQYFDFVLHIPFLFYWAACVALAVYLAWRPGLHLSILALIFWLVLNTEGLTHLLGWHDAEALTIFILLPLAIWSVMQVFDGRGTAFSITAGHYAFFVFLFAYALLQFFDNENQPPAPSWLIFAGVTAAVSLAAGFIALQRREFAVMDMAGLAFALLTTIAYVHLAQDDNDHLKVPYLAFGLIVILWSLMRGVRRDDRFVINLSTVAFGLWVLYAYFVMFEGLLNQAMFFTVGGILLILLSLGLEGMRRRLTSRPATTEGAAS